MELQEASGDAVAEMVGYGAAIARLPPLLRSLSRLGEPRSTNDVSLTMFSVMLTGIGLWLTYGALKHDVPLIVANATTLFLTGTLLFLKLKYT
jgi:MtN3 and saliva related transmembrane protein